MNKTQFIQTVLPSFLTFPEVRERPIEQRFDMAISMAEKAWERLSARGYGCDKASRENDAKRNWYAELPDQEAFDKAWFKFGKHGVRDKAAKAWIGIPETDKPKVILAIPRYLEQISQTGTAKAHFETWLNQKRWESFDIQERQAPAEIDDKIGNIKALQRLIQNTIDPNTKQALQAQLDRLTN